MNQAPAPKNEMIYEAAGLSYSINGRLLLNGISFGVGRGEFLAVIGPNGAGKTTLLRHLVRIIRPPRGTVRLSGRCINSFSRREIAARVGYVPQSSPDYLPFTALQFVLMGRYPHTSPLARPGEDEFRKARAILDKVGMADFADRRVDRMSGGERQKVLMAAALAQEPEILLLDEPTTFLDPKHQSDIQEMIETLNREQGISVVAVSHDINFAARFSRRVIALKEGGVVYDGPVRGILGNGRLESLFDTPFEFVENGGGLLAFPKRKNGGRERNE